MAKVSLDDRKTYEMLARGDAIGVFQFESSGMREALRSVRPTEFEDLIALVALYRPGPMGYIPAYAKRKNGQETVSFIDPRLEAITGVTHGICIYQEQYLEIAKRIAGFSPAEADDRARRSATDSRADGVPQGEVPRGLGTDRDDPGGREPALEGHGVVAGLLVREVTRRLLRADRVPDGLAAREPPA